MPALFRRFDDVLHYDLPDQSQIATLLRSRLAEHASKATCWVRLAEVAAGLSHAEIARATDEVLKDALIGQRARVREPDILSMLLERKAVCDRLNEKSTS